MAGGIGLAGRRYRTKLELLRDFLAAAQSESLKTRIMFRANLNQVSFHRYASICQDQHLLVRGSGGYFLTPRAEDLLHSINQVLSKAIDLRIAVEVMNRTARSGGFQIPRSEVFLRPAERMDMSDFLSLPLSNADRRPQLVRQG